MPPPREQLMGALRNADAAGDTEGARRIAAMIQKPAADPPAPEEDPTSSENLIGAATEPTLAMASGAAGTVAGGLAGLGALGTNALGITNTPAADVVSKVQGAMTYQPRTSGGQTAMKVFSALGDLVKQAGGKVGDWAMDPKNKTALAFALDGMGLPGEKLVANPNAIPKIATALDTLTQAIPDIAGSKGAGEASAGLRVLPKTPVRAGVRRLASEGVTMTPGQRRGGMMNTAEQKATSIPLVGDVIKSARGRAVGEWNTARLNEGLKDAAATPVPKGMTGRDAIRHAKQELERRYTAVVGKMHGDLNSAPQTGSKLPAIPGQPLPGSFASKLAQTKSMLAQGKLDPKITERVTRIIDNEVIGRFEKSGKASGETIKAVQESLRVEADNLRRGGYDERKGAQALDQVRSDLKDMLVRENPQLAKELEGIDKGYAKYKTAARASTYAKADRGVYSPAQRLQSIRARDVSKDKDRFATGRAHDQRNTEEAQDILGNTVPDSGSAGRIALLEGLLSGPSLVAGHPLGAAGMASLPAIYSAPMLRLLQRNALSGKTLGTTAATGLAFGSTQQPDQHGLVQP